MDTSKQHGSRPPTRARSSLFAYGFRVHFLLAGLAALLLVPWWAASYTAGFAGGSDWAPTLWHAHEMLFGFIAAAIAGFMLTAVPSWTGQKGVAGRPLQALAVLWLAGRILIASSALWPQWLVTFTDLAFLPAVAALVAPPLVRTRNRNAPLLAVLAVLWLCNVCFHVLRIRLDAPAALHALHLGIDFVLLLLTVVGGRIVPAFTAAVLRQRNLPVPVPRGWLDALAIGTMVAVALVDAWAPEGRVSGVLALVAAAIQGARLAQWHAHRTLSHPILWALHLAYAWLPVGLALKGIALLQGAAFAAFWLHALTIGALATMILAVMTRASLGHTGRPLTAQPPIVAAYLLLTASALVRVFGLSVLPLGYTSVIACAALLWTATFALFIVVYAPILTGPRVDGRNG